MIGRVRSNANLYPANSSILEANMPAKSNYYTMTTFFLLHDSTNGDDRVLIFSTEKNLEFLARSPDWYANSTFKTVPRLFYQLYTIHGVSQNRAIPAVFALLAGKTSRIYLQLFNQPSFFLI
ncbi:hypothetical protein CDIK_2156 [Cucumispora dikerogammari]|nr:hypothetical protein CDIK_2156 [Cucumispora dikerogammari]